MVPSGSRPARQYDRAARRKPGSKMASAGADWQSNAATQIRWGLGYIQQTYGSPCAAWDHSEAVGWY